MIAVLMPTTSPAAVTSGPPEFPGLSAASVWMTLSISRPDPGAQRTAERADDARSDRALKAERVADRDDQLADPQPARIAEPREGGRLALEPQHGKIRVGVVADQSRRESAPVGKGRLDLARAADHMAVGQNIRVGGKDDAGAGTVGAFVCSGDLQVKDRGTDPVDRTDDGPRIGVEQSEVLGSGGIRRRRSTGLGVADRIVDWGEIVIHGKNKVGTSTRFDKMASTNTTGR